MVKIQVNSQGKAYFTSGNKVLLVSGGGDTISAINNTGAAITSGDKVFIAPLATPQSGANYELIKPKIATNPMFGFLTGNTASVGNPTINLTDKTVSNFYYQYRWLEVPQVMDYSQPWEFNICFQTGSSVSEEQYIWFSNDTTWGNSGLMVYLYSGNIEVGFGNNVDETSTIYLTSNSISANTIYYLKVGGTGTSYYAKYSTDGTTWTDFPNSPLSTQQTIAQASTGVLIGCRYNSGGFSQTGKIYMDKTYLTSGDSIQWQMYSDGASNLGSNILTGTASDSIAAGSVGDVTTILGE